MEEHRILIDSDTLREDHIPDIIRYREEPMTRFRSFYFSGPIVGRNSGHLFIQGPPGTGKTLCTNYLIDETKRKLQELGKNDVGIFYLNCSTCPTQIDTARALARQVGSDTGATELTDLPKTYSISDILSLTFSAINNRYKYVLIILDEVDKILPANPTEKDTLFYILVRARELKMLTNTYHGVCCIANDTRCRDKLAVGTRDSFGSYWVHFPRYKQEQLEDILWQRVTEACVPNSVGKEVVKTIAQYCFEREGSARQAILLLNNTLAEAEMGGADSVTMEHYNMAKSTRERQMLVQTLDELGLHSSLAFFVMIGSYHASGQYPHLQQLFVLYSELCAKIKKEPVRMDTLRKYYNELVSMGLAEDFTDGNKTFFKPTTQSSLAEMVYHDINRRYNLGEKILPSDKRFNL